MILEFLGGGAFGLIAKGLPKLVGGLLKEKRERGRHFREMELLTLEMEANRDIADINANANIAISDNELLESAHSNSNNRVNRTNDSLNDLVEFLSQSEDVFIKILTLLPLLVFCLRGLVMPVIAYGAIALFVFGALFYDLPSDMTSILSTVISAIIAFYFVPDK